MTWDEKVATLDWSKLVKEGELPFIPIEVITTVPRELDIADILALIKFGMN